MRVPATALGCGLALAAAKETTLHQPPAAAYAAAAAAAAGAGSSGLTVEHNPPQRPAAVTPRGLGRAQQQLQQRRKRGLATGHRCGSTTKPSAEGSQFGRIPCFLAPLGRYSGGVWRDEGSTCSTFSQLSQPHRRDRRPLPMAMRGRCVVRGFSEIGDRSSLFVGSRRGCAG